MMWDLPVSVTIHNIEYLIRNKCDYRVILDTIVALNDKELSLENRLKCALYIFYEDLTQIEDVQEAISQMMKIINLGKECISHQDDNMPPLMSWEHDFPLIAPPVSRILGYSVRDENNYTHWYDFIGAYQEIGECSWSTIVSIRNKRRKGRKLDDEERRIYEENKEIINLPQQLSEEDADWLDLYD